MPTTLSVQFMTEIVCNINEVPQMKLRTTVIRLVVNVPVLSEQMVVALPIVSQAYRCLTRLLSDIILYGPPTDDTTHKQEHVSGIRHAYLLV